MDAILGSIVTGLGPVGMRSGPVSYALLAIPAVGGKAIGVCNTGGNQDTAAAQCTDEMFCAMICELD